MTVLSGIVPRGAGRTEGLVAAGVVAAVMLAAVAAAMVAGFDVQRALGALWEGSFGSWYAFTSGTLVRATPLILTGLAVSLAFRAGVFNIGAEGQLLAGAALATAVAVHAGAGVPAAIMVPAVLAAGVTGGAAWAGIAALLRLRFRVLEVISTLLLNFVALHLVGYLVRGPLQEPLRIYPQSDAIPGVAQLPALLAGTRLHLGFAAAVFACAAAWVWLRYTAGGFRLRAAGANPRAAHSGGEIRVARVTALAFLTSGAFAGLAGASELAGVTYALYENISPGYGYTAIAVALLARLNPAAVIVAGTFFGALEAGASAMQRDAGVPMAVVFVIEAAIILLLLAVGRVRALLPGMAR